MTLGEQKHQKLLIGWSLDVIERFEKVAEYSNSQHCVYGTPYGDFMIGITAKTIRSDLDENGGMLFFHYVLDVNSSYIGDFEIAIEVKAANVVA